MKVYIDAPLVAVALFCAVAASIAFERMPISDDKHFQSVQDKAPTLNPLIGQDSVSGAPTGVQPGLRPVALSTDYLRYPPLISDEAILELWAQNKRTSAPLIAP
ncbi:hypothetical protein HCH_04639 [Hahella chejuensis KCTC 2396]|uniref:Uncharacterized protein n=1 Tax=Hahella chejuensis (strain KCTC 2396) TaxID=349521 RepID=Q2SDD6_HAHCH|nr:hypothetical protein [Hahella chejuensis]ABC31338.1 hypothetical protein HCH_04639 [Hahella chejuensis KCTC 2396]